MNDESDDELTLDDWNSGEKFVLCVHGDMMIGEHIRDGDYVVIKKQDHAKDGEIIVLRDDEGEATLRRIRYMNGHVLLEAANPDVKSIKRESVNIIGVLIGVVRKYCQERRTMTPHHHDADLVTTLRHQARDDEYPGVQEMQVQAADEIERLGAEVAQLRAALKLIPFCPVCGYGKSAGHPPTCKLGALLNG